MANGGVSLDGAGNIRRFLAPLRMGRLSSRYHRQTQESAGAETPIAIDPTPVSLTHPVQKQLPNATSVAHTDTGPVKSIRAEQVAVRTKMQSVEVARDSLGDSTLMLPLRKMALSEPPVAREDMLSRHVVENRLSLTPEIYNLLAFGETEESSASTAKAPTCALPPRHRPNRRKDFVSCRKYISRSWV